MSRFYNKPSLGFTCWGCRFDSLTELKFAISIANDYEFLRATIPVFFNPKTRQTSDYSREGFRRYVPDFLIRHKITGEAFWVEIKPEGFDDTAQLDLRRTVAEDYIRRKKFDWKYKVVYGNEITLDEKGNKLFEQCCTLKLCVEMERELPEGFRFDPNEIPLFSKRPANGMTAFIMFGTSGRTKNNFSKQNI